MNDSAHGLIRRLRESLDGLPAAQRSVVGVILEDPRAAAGATVEQLAQTIGEVIGSPRVVEFDLTVTMNAQITLTPDPSTGG